jgi:hypothetical protein
MERGKGNGERGEKEEERKKEGKWGEQEEKK